MKAVKILLCVLVASLLVVPAAFAEVNVAGSMRAQFTVESTSNGSDEMILSGGDRLKFTVSGKTENEDGMFAGAQAQAMIKTDGTVGVDDAWLEVGTPTFSAKIGRFEAEGLFSMGEDIFVIAAPGGPDAVETNKSRGRTNAGAALRFSPSETMAIEIGTVLGGADDYSYTVSSTDLGTITTSTGSVIGYTEEVTGSYSMNMIGFRPVLILTAGAATIKAGVDYYMERPRDSDNDREYDALGAGADLAFQVSDTMKVGGSFGYLKEDGKDGNGNDAEDETSMSFSGYLTMNMGDNILGLAAKMTMRDEADDSHIQGYVSYQMPLPVEGAWVKFCPSFASYSNGEDTSAFGGRVRFE
jgi:hypothetical protein